MVRAVNPGEELEEEAGFVGGAAAGVEEGFAGGDFPQLRRDSVERLVPGDRPKMRIPRAGVHRLADPSDHFHLARREPFELIQRVGLEEPPLDFPLHVGGHGLELKQ